LPWREGLLQEGAQLARVYGQILFQDHQSVFRASGRITASEVNGYKRVTSGWATTRPEHVSTRVQKPPSQIDPKGAVHEA
jgi:hypothetical protein